MPIVPTTAAPWFCCAMLGLELGGVADDDGTRFSVGCGRFFGPLISRCTVATAPPAVATVAVVPFTAAITLAKLKPDGAATAGAAVTVPAKVTGATLTTAGAAVLMPTGGMLAVDTAAALASEAAAMGALIAADNAAPAASALPTNTAPVAKSRLVKFFRASVKKLKFCFT